MCRMLITAALAAAVALTAPANAATLTGRTTNIFGVAVSAVPYEVRDSRDGTLLSAPGSLTSGTGDFSVTVPVGRYDVSFSPPISAHVFGAVRNGVRVDVTTTLNVQLAPGQLLTGRIVTPAGAAVSHVALQLADPLFLTPPANVANAVTDEAGNVNVLVSPGTWRVSGEPRLDQGIAPRILGTFNLNADGSLGIATMLPGFVVTGRILDPVGTPLAAAEFYVQDPASGAELYTPTDATDALGVARFVIPAGTYDVIGVPPLGPVFAARALRRVVVSAATDLGDVTLPAGANLFARTLDSALAPVAGVDCLVDSLPSGHRLALVNPQSDAAGNVSAVVTPGSLRVAFAPAVSTRLLPVVFEPLEVTAATDLGNVILRDGHWVDFRVREAGTGRPIAGAVLEFIDATTGRTALTLGDTTDAAGAARVTLDRVGYQLVVRPPSPTWNTLTVTGFTTLRDTLVTLDVVNPAIVLPAEVDVGAAAGAISACTPLQSVPVTLSRTASEPIKAFSVSVQLSAELQASGGVAAFSDGGFFPNPTFHVTDRGNGLYTIDNAELTLEPCGVSATSGTLFQLLLAGTGTPGTGSVAITDVKLRDCANAALAVAAGASGPVRVAAALALSESHTSTCLGAPDGAIDLSVSGGTPPYAYAWSNGATTQDVSALATGPHSVTVTDAAGCTATLAVDIVLRSYTVTASAGTGGSVAPAGAVAVACGASESFVLSPDVGFHVASVLLDGVGIGFVNPVTLADVTADRTLSVTFAVNPPVAPITDLAAVQLRKGNDTDGITKIALSWGAVPAGAQVEVWRAAFGNYPLYEDGPVPGQVPAPPVSYPPAGWTLTAVAAPGDLDEPASRDQWYYVAYVVDALGTRSPVSNRTAGVLDYHLGDVSNGVAGQGDNSVNTLDLSLLGLHYGKSGAAMAAVSYLDVGPTVDFSNLSRPITDHLLDFEDLVVFAINYNPAVSAPRAWTAAAAADRITLAAPEHVVMGERVNARLRLEGTGRVQAASVVLTWDPAVVRPLGHRPGALLEQQGGVVLSSRPGTLDAAVMAGNGTGLVGEGELAVQEFEVVAPGDPGLRIVSVDGRDQHNGRVVVTTARQPVVPRETAFAPASPNPFAARTTLAFTLAERGVVELAVYSVAGRRVRGLANGVQEPGEFRFEWDGRDDGGHAQPPGVYYARFTSAAGRWTRTVTLLR
ncbi:MAG: FlgD immunoglobulin-like domain containing protein [Candidatus Eisenbacteria bacterium]